MCKRVDYKKDRKNFFFLLPSVVVCLLLEAAYYAVIGQQNGRKAGLHVGLSRGQVDGSC